MLHVGDDADDLHDLVDAGARFDAEALADRIASGKRRSAMVLFTMATSIDPGAIALGEFPSVEQPDAERLEVAGRDDAVFRLRHLLAAAPAWPSTTKSTDARMPLSGIRLVPPTASTPGSARRRAARRC